MNMKSYSVAFTSVKGAEGHIRRYPLLPVLLDIKGQLFHINFLLDSGSDYSLLPRTLVQDGFGIHIEDLPRGENQQGLGGSFPTALIEGTIRFGTVRTSFKENIGFIVSREPTVEPNFCLLGREPFFNEFRVDFRMGWHKNRCNGKFTIYPEK